MSKPRYEWRHYDHPQKFLLALRRSNPEWSRDNEWQSHWVFRGCASASWNLVPSAWLKLKFKSLYDKYLEWDWKDLELEASLVSDYMISKILGGCDKERAKHVIAQVLFERSLIYDYYKTLDRMGFPVPGFVEPRDDHFKYQRWFFENGKFPPIFALAQHHGIPTRLLDWTLNPLKAIFFAASENTSVKDDDDLAVWAWNVESEDENFNSPMFEVQRAHVGFLSAQEGVFSYMPDAASHYLNNGKWPIFEEWIPTHLLRKLSIARKHAPELLRLLYLEGITPFSLMPTHDNITKSVETVMKHTIKPIKHADEEDD